MVSIGSLLGGVQYLDLETDRIMPGYVGDVYRDFWAYENRQGEETHRVATTLDIGNTGIISPQIRASGKAKIWTGEALDMGTQQWEIGGERKQAIFWAFAVTETWLQRHRAEVARRTRIMPERDWYKMGIKIGSMAIKQAMHDRILSGSVESGVIVEDGLFRANNIPVIQESDNLYTIPPNDLFTKMKRYIINFKVRGNLNAENIKLLYPPSLAEQFGAKLSIDGTRISEDIATALTKRLPSGLNTTDPMWLTRMMPKLELESDWLETIGVHPVGTNKCRMVLLAELPQESTPFSTRNPQIWRGERMIDYTEVERINLQSCFLVFAMQTPMFFDNNILATFIEFPKQA